MPRRVSSTYKVYQVGWKKGEKKGKEGETEERIMKKKGKKREM